MIGSVTKALIVSVFLLLIGCATPQIDRSVIKRINSPELNQVATAELGDTTLTYFYSATIPSFRLLAAWAPSDLGRVTPIPAGHILTPTYEDENYEAFKEYWLCFDKKKKQLVSKGTLHGKCSALSPNWGGADRIVYERANYVDLSQPNFKQELIYNGKVGSNVKFLYREASTGLMRDAFRQEVQYDLNEGNEIGFKGARLEIIEATNRKLTYKVKSFFRRD